MAVESFERGGAPCHRNLLCPAAGVTQVSVYPDRTRSSFSMRRKTSSEIRPSERPDRLSPGVADGYSRLEVGATRSLTPHLSERDAGGADDGRSGRGFEPATRDSATGGLPSSLRRHQRVRVQNSVQASNASAASIAATTWRWNPAV